MTQRTLNAPRFASGEYEIEDVLGVGGMSVVYSARDSRRPRRVAVKVLRAEVAQSGGLERFEREITLAASLTHPNILPVLDSGEAIDDKGRPCPYYVTPIVSGESLQARIAREQRLPVDDVLRIMRELLDALAYAHAHGVIHRDIKPSNILLAGEHVFVADFGVARLFSESSTVTRSTGERITASGFAVGTPTYMSPEQALGEQNLDPRTDLYGAACVMYEMLTGVPPFDAPTAQALISRKLNGSFVPVIAMRPTVSPAFDDVLRKAMSPEPSDRHKTAMEFRDALEHLRTPSTGMVALPPRTTHRSNWTYGVVAILLAISGTSWMAWGRGDPVAPVGDRDKTHVAVLPFETLGSDSTLSFFSAGLTGDLIDELSRFPALHVISRNGVRPFRDPAISIDSIARLLNVGSIVTGEVREDVDSVRVSVRVIDGTTNRQVGIMQAAGLASDILTVRSAVIDSVTVFLRSVIGAQVAAGERQRVRSAEAWSIVERVRNMTRDARGFRMLAAPQRAARYAEEESLLVHAIQLDDRWPAPYSEAARLNLDRATLEEGLTAAEAANRAQDTSLPSALRRRAIAWTDRALTIDRNDARALHLRGRARFGLWRNARERAQDSLLVRAESDLRAAVAGRGDMAEAWNDLSILLQEIGNYTESYRAADTALKSDAFLDNAAAVIARLQFASLATGRIDDAKQWCARGQQRFPQDPRFWGCELTILGWTGSTNADLDRAWTLLSSSESRDTLGILKQGAATRRLFVAAIAARAGMRDSALSIVSAARPVNQAVPQPQFNYGAAHVHAILGNRDAALEHLADFLRASPTSRALVRNHPWFVSLRREPRFIALTAPE